jgi:quercetin dioxygenase-like cupin family protein
MLMFQNVAPDAGFLAGVIELSTATEPRSHLGSELVLVLRGAASITVEGRIYLLKEGESIYISEGETHSYGPAEGTVEPVSLFAVRVH